MWLLHTAVNTVGEAGSFVVFLLQTLKARLRVEIWFLMVRLESGGWDDGEEVDNGFCP